MNKPFKMKLLACILGIVILIFIASTYREHVIKEEKTPYLTQEEFIPQVRVLEELSGTSLYEDILHDKDTAEPEYITVGMVKKLLVSFPLVEAEVLNDYKKDTWYIGVSDWNTILVELTQTYGGELLYMTELTILGDETNCKDRFGNAIEEGCVLTQQGVMEAVYWNTRAYFYSRVSAICYQEEILSILGETEEEGRLTNVYLADVTIDRIHLFAEHTHFYYPFQKEDGSSCVQLRSGSQFMEGAIVDVAFQGNQIYVDAAENELVHGKLLQVSEDGIEIEGYGIYMPSEEMKIYRLYGELDSMEKKDLRIGYSFTDFVVENGKVEACLMIKEEDMAYIRVLLKNTEYEGKYHENFKAVCDQEYELIYYENGVETAREEKRAGEAFELHADAMPTTAMRIKMLPKVLSANITVESIQRNQGKPSYKGSLEITGSQEGLLLVNEVLLEDYLYTVVPSEMPSSYPKEALMAQAVSARTYAYGKMIKTGLPDYGAHLDDSAGFQVYNNITATEKTTAAVKATHNTIAVYEGEPIGMYYYSTSCGSGSDSSIWHSSLEVQPYLNAKIIGEEEITPEALMEEEAFKAWIQTNNQKHYEAEDGWYRWTYTVDELDTEYLCSVLQKRYEKYPHQILTQTAEGEFVSQPITAIGEIQNIEVIKRLPGGVADELLITGSKAVIKVIAELNIRSVLADGKTKVHRQTNDEVAAPSSIPSAYIVIEPKRLEETVTGYVITGGGFGHGVGMSQNGARYMAERGMHCEEILQFFYPQTELKVLQYQNESGSEG